MDCFTFSNFNFKSHLKFEVSPNGCEPNNYYYFTNSNSSATGSISSSINDLREDTDSEQFDLMENNSNSFSLYVHERDAWCKEKDEFLSPSSEATNSSCSYRTDRGFSSAQCDELQLSDIYKDQQSSSQETSWSDLSPMVLNSKFSTSTYSSSSFPTFRTSPSVNKTSINRKLGQRQRPRKSSRNARERQYERQHYTNAGFEALRRLIPTFPPGRKLSKKEILESAKKYIKLLESVLQWQSIQAA